MAFSDIISIDRLMRITNPFYKLPLITKKDCMKASPISEAASSSRQPKGWIIRRIAYYMQHLDDIEPIKVSVGGIGQSVYDGRLRLLAHIFAGRKTIKASCCGATDVIEYLRCGTDLYGGRTLEQHLSNE